MLPPETEARLEDRLSEPRAEDIALMRRLSGNLMVLGAGGKMGPCLARLARRAADAAGAALRVVAVSQVFDPRVRTTLEDTGIETLACDLLDRSAIDRLPPCENVLYLVGRKFGSTERTDLTWAVNAFVPGLVASHFKESRIVVFSTGNVYPFVNASSRGSVESDLPDPRGEYAQACLGRERLFEYFSIEHGLRCLIYRLNYAVDLRYGVLVDIARRVHEGNPVSLTVPCFNVLWQGDAASYALRSLEYCAAPPRILNITGPEKAWVREVAQEFGRRFGRHVVFTGLEGPAALLSDAALCQSLLGPPSVSLPVLIDWVGRWIEIGGSTLDKPTKFEVTDGRF